MNLIIKYSKKLPLAVFTLLMICAFAPSLLRADTSKSVYDNLNTETKNFVNRLNQIPQNFIFNQILKNGYSVSPDVQYLKWILNSDTRTSLTDNPNMTMDQLTSFYGPITENAVKRFQTLYRSEILDPQGIVNPTGIVGEATRIKLNSLLTKSRLIVNYNDVLNTALNQRSGSNNSATSSSGVDFSYLAPLNLDTIFSNYSKTNISTSTEEYKSAMNMVASSSNNGAWTKSSTSAGNDSAMGASDPNAILSQSPAPGVVAPYTMIGVVALMSGDFLGANIASYLSGKGTGLTGAKNLISDYTSTLSGGTIGGNKSGGGGSAGALIGGGMSFGGSGTTGSASQSVLAHFGGEITMNMTCPCSANYMLTILDKGTNTSLSIMFQPGLSSLKMNYNPTVGETVLGGYIRGTASCMIYEGTSCSSYGNPVGTIDSIRGIGTTLAPASGK